MSSLNTVLAIVFAPSVAMISQPLAGNCVHASRTVRKKQAYLSWDNNPVIP